MIDKLQRIALAIQFLRFPSIAVGLLCVTAIVIIIFTSVVHDGDRFLIPSFVGLLWAMDTYLFIEIFRSVPEKADTTLKLFSKLKRNFSRAWYWLVSVVFLGTTLAAIYVTSRMVSIWLRGLNDLTSIQQFIHFTT